MKNSLKLATHYNGFTLIELMLGLLIGAIVMALSTPMINMVRANRASSLTHEFATALNFTRSEAIKRGNTVTICRTIKGDRCEGDKDIDHQKDWSNGWIVFSDVNGNGQLNTTQDEILVVHGPLPKGYTLRSNAKVRVTYKPIGISPGYMDSWTLCGPGKKAAITKGIVVAYTGRVRFARDTNNNGTIDNGTLSMKGDPRELECRTHESS